MKIQITVNGERKEVDVNPKMKVSYLLHDILQIQSVKSSCGAGACGSCIVIIEDKACPSCLLPAFAVQEKSIMTFEGIRELPDYHYIISGFRSHNYFPCDYCLPVKVVLIYELLLQNGSPGSGDILFALRGNICSCDAYGPLTAAVMTAAELKREQIHG